MKPPRLLAPSRRGNAALLILCALGQAAAAAGLAEALRAAMHGAPATWLTTAALVSTLALVGGAAVLGERWVGERLAQSFVVDTRRALFEAMLTKARGGTEARWMTPFVGDLAALRNWAARGPIRLATSAVAAVAAAAWFAVAWPDGATALWPFLAALGLMLAIFGRLCRTIADQRVARGVLTRFLIRRVRAEVEGRVSGRGHGRKGLHERSTLLASLAERRAIFAGLFDAAAVAAGGIASLILIQLAAGGGTLDQSALVAGLMLLAFIAARVFELARALHAHAGGRVALVRIGRMLSQGDPVPQTSGKKGPDNDPIA